jgi:outer membrane lipoprotein-sorting protein
VLNGYSQNIDEVLSKYMEATGGKTNWENIKSIKYTGYSNIMGMDIPYTQYVKRPGMWLIEIYVQGEKIIQGYDGTKGWIVNPMSGSKKASEVDEETSKIFKYNALIGGKLYNIDNTGFTAELAGKEDLEGKEVYKINLTDKDGAVYNFFIDANSYLITKAISKVKRMGNEVITESLYNNYKKVEDVFISYLMEQKITGGQFDIQTVTIDKVELNTEIDDNIFKMPIE